MSIYSSFKKFAAVQCKALTLAAIGAALIAPTSLMAQTLPTMPPSGYDEGGRFAAGSINDVYYYSSVAGRDLKMIVYTPPGYNTNEKYSVVYCYQGIDADPGYIFAPWCVGAGTICDNLIGEGKISKGMIIVAVDDQFNGAWNSDVRAMTLNDAIPYIDSHYSTYADADHRGLYGYSWGGGYAFNVGCSSLDTFHHISPSSAAPNKAADDVLFPNGGAEAKQKLKTLLISCGDSDWMGLYPASLNCHNYCDANGIPNYWLSVAGGNHDGGVWRPAMWNFLQLMNNNTVTIKRLQNRASGKFLDCLGRADNGDQVAQWDSTQGTTYFTNQVWVLTPVDSTWYTLKCVGNNKFLDTLGNTSDGSAVGMWNSTAGNWYFTNQQWKMQATDSGYFQLINRGTGKALDTGGNNANGAGMQQWYVNPSYNQQWILR